MKTLGGKMEIICYACGRKENPENTMKAIEHCQAVNPEYWIEMDLQLTADKVVVLFHDKNLARITGLNKYISELNWAELSQLNAGHNFEQDGEYYYRENPLRIAKLEEVFINFPNAKLMLDVHSPNLEIVARVISLIEEYGYRNQFVIASQYQEIIERFKIAKPDWLYGASANEVKKMVYSSFIFLDDLFPISSDILMIPIKYGSFKIMTKRVIKHAKKRKKKLWLWVYEGKEQANKAKEVLNIETVEQYNHLKRQGIDGVFIDHPERLSKDLAIELS